MRKEQAELQLRLLPTEEIGDESTVFTGIQPRVEISRRRMVVILLMDVSVSSEFWWDAKKTNQ
jgi:hypothetical protein